MNNISIIEQQKILKKAFPKAKIEIPKGFKSMAVYNANAEDEALIPHWTLIGKDYNDAVQKVLDAIKKSRPFYNYREGQLGSEYLKETPEKIDGLSQFFKSTFVLPVQTGTKWAGKSVETARKEKQKNEVLLGAYEMGMIFLTHPDRLEKYEDLWIDCAGDEFAPDADGRFVSAPFFLFRDGELFFITYWVGVAFDKYGSASGFLSQYPSPVESLESFDSSPLATRIQKLEEFKEKVEKILKL